MYSLSVDYKRPDRQQFFLEQALDLYKDNVSALYYMGKWTLENCKFEVDEKNGATKKSKHSFIEGCTYLRKCVRTAFYNSRIVKFAYIELALAENSQGNTEEAKRYAKQARYADLRIPLAIQHMTARPNELEERFRTDFPDLVIVRTCDQCNKKIEMEQNNCLCGLAFYCSDSCKKDHLPLHNDTCPLKRPNPVGPRERENEMDCASAHSKWVDLKFIT